MHRRWLFLLIFILGGTAFVPYPPASGRPTARPNEPSVGDTSPTTPTPQPRSFPQDWTSAAPGIDYRAFSLPGPNQAFVTRMDRSNPAVLIDTAMGGGMLTGGREPLSQMAARYEDTVDYWDGQWGGRRHVVAALNGDYLDVNNDVPQNGQIQGDWLIKRFNNFEGWTGFAWTNTRQAIIGQCGNVTAQNQLIFFPDLSAPQNIDELNAPRSDGQLVLYTPQYGPTTGTSPAGVEVVVETGQPLLGAMPPYALPGKVVAIHDHAGSTPVPYDGVVLSASGTARDQLLAHVKVGDTIGISQGTGSLDTDCQTPFPLDWSNVYAGIGGAFTFLREGQPRHTNATGALVTNPRSAVAFNDQYVFFIVVDGRATGVSLGMTFDQLAEFARDQLSATWGVAQDGGGSTTLVVNGQVVNTPSDPCQNGSTASDTDLSQPLPVQQGATCERPVINGLLMVVQEPADFSTALSVGDSRLTPIRLDLRTGPGTNYPLADHVPSGATLQVVADQNGLDGVRATGDYWWRVSSGDASGWVQESALFSSNG